jgi:putative ATP-dependent endonuclease of the OLD family
MKLKRIKIKNFKSIKEVEFDFPDAGILVLVGENNSGKSNIIRAIDAISGEGWYGKEKLEDHDFYLRNRANQIDVSLCFDNNRVLRFKPTSTDWGIKYYTSHAQSSTMPYGSSIKEDFPCTYLGADRTFDKHLAFYDWTLIGRIRKAFHRRITPALNTAIQGQFELLIEHFDEVPGFAQFKEDFTNYFTELLPLAATKIGITFKPYTPANLFKSMQILALDQDQNNNPIDVDELGEGARNIILISLLRSYAKNLKTHGEQISGILALEEPELFLHPQARRHMARVLRELADDGIQIIISTHSDSFIDTEFFDSIGRVIKVDDSEAVGRKCSALITCNKQKLVDYCISTGVPAAKTNQNNISEFYKTTSNPRLNEGFFARLLVLVEGETEELCFPEYLKWAGVDCDSLGISIVSVQGKNQIPKYWRLYNQFQIPIIPVFDNDNSNEKVNSNVQLANCFELTVNDFINDVALAKKIISPKGCDIIVIETDFESSIRSQITPTIYDVFYAEAKALIKPINNQQKGVISRFIARKILENDPDFIPRSVQLLKEAITQRLGLTYQTQE